MDTVLKYSKVDLDMTDKKIKDYTTEIVTIDDKIKLLVPEQQKVKLMYPPLSNVVEIHHRQSSRGFRLSEGRNKPNRG
jgi:hypothetical protein